MPPELDDGQLIDAPVVEASENSAPETPEGGDAPETPDNPETPTSEAPEPSGDPAEPEPPKKSPIARLQGRVGHLTKQLSDQAAELEQARRRAEAAEALLNGGEAAATPTAATPAPGTPDFQAAVQTEAQRLAAQARFDTDCNTIFDAGVTKHGEAAFQESVANLNALGLMDARLVEAAMATDTPADVIHALGSDVDEAARIMALSPVRMAAEVVKLAGKLSTPASAPKPSGAPPPITPVGGAVQANHDVSDPNISMDEYVRRRKAAGSRWAK